MARGLIPAELPGDLGRRTPRTLGVFAPSRRLGVRYLVNLMGSSNTMRGFTSNKITAPQSFLFSLVQQYLIECCRRAHAAGHPLCYPPVP